MVIVSRVASACFILALPIFLVTANVRFLAGDVAFYKHGFREYDAAQRTGIALPELDRSAGQIIDYFENDADTLRIVVDTDGQEVSLFNPKETEHMRDVKSLMQLVFRVNEGALAYIVAYLAAAVLWSRERSVRDLARESLVGVGVGVVAAGVVGGLALSGFDATWRRFHELVFSNDLWRLNPATDRLIQMFPQGFWEEATLIVVALTAAEAIAIVSASVLYLLLSRGTPAETPETVTAPRREPRTAH